MNTITNFLRRVFNRKPRPAPRFEYIAERDLPADPVELIRAGVVAAWRVDHFGERWFQSEPGALNWYQRSFVGETDD